MNDNILQNILNELKSINRDSGRFRFGPDNTDPGEGFIHDGQDDSNDPVDSMRKRAEAFNKQIDKGNKTLKDLENSQRKMFKSMLEGVPIFGRVYKSLKRSSDTIEEISQGQSKAYRESAKAAGEFAGSANTSAEELKKVNDKIHDVYGTSQKISKISKDKAELERKILDSFEKTSMKGEQVAHDLSNISDLMEKTRKEREKENANTAELDKALKNLESIEELGEAFASIPEEVENLKKSLSEADFAKILKNNPKLAEMFKGLDSGSNDEIVDKLEDLDDTGGKLAGFMDALGITMRDSIDVQRQFQKDFKDAMADLGKAVSAALGEAIVKESTMMMTRQRLTGAPMGYAARARALEMGMSETDALTSLSENRYLFRRIARDSGLATGAGDLLQSGNLNELRTLSREMGLVGKEALDNLVAVSDDLRVLGTDLTKANIAGSVSFIRDSFKDLGLTQEQMRQFFGEMSREGMMATMVAGPTDRFANLEVMQEEIKYRGQLARVLNQELEIQKKRVQEMSQAAYGSPAEAIRKSVGMEILAQSTGMSRSDQRLLSEFARTGGRSMNTQDRRRAIEVREQLGLNVGRELDVAARGDQIGRRAFLTQMISMGGMDAMESVRAYQRNRGTEIGDIGGLARTENPAYETNDLLNKAVTAFEYGQGVLKSAIGASTGAIVSAIGSATVAVVASNLAAGRGMGFGTALKGMGRSAGNRIKGMGRIGGIGAGTALGAGIAATGRTAGERTMGLGVTGASIGAYFGLPGAAIGGALGLGAGGLYELLKDEKKAGFTDMNRALGTDYGAGPSPNIKMSDSDISEIAKARRNYNFDEARKKELEILERNSSKIFGAAGLSQNYERLQDFDRSIANIKRGRGPAPSSGKLTEDQEKEINRYKSLRSQVVTQMSQDVTELVETGDFKVAARSKEAIQSMIEVLKDDEVADEEQKDLFQQLKDWMALGADQRQEQIEAIKEGNEQEAKHYGEMNEADLRNQINSRLMGISDSALNRSYGAAQKHSR